MGVLFFLVPGLDAVRENRDGHTEHESQNADQNTAQIGAAFEDTGGLPRPGIVGVRRSRKQGGDVEGQAQDDQEADRQGRRKNEMGTPPASLVFYFRSSLLNGSQSFFSAPHG